MTNLQNVAFLYACHRGAKRLASRMGWSYERTAETLRSFPGDWQIAATWYGGYRA